MASQQIALKVYHVQNGVNKEIRKFTLDGDVAANFEYMMGRIKVFFTELLRGDLRLFYKDEEDDLISISSDDELFEVIKAYQCPNDLGYLKLWIQVKSKHSPPINSHHTGIVCDGCDGNINGIRYKCMVCPDFDLCSTCEGKNHHPVEHNMLCIKKPSSRVGCYRFSPLARTPSCILTPLCNFPSQHCYQPSIGKENKCDADSDTIKSFIHQIASTFGLDPEVAVTQTQSFFDHLHSNSTAESDKENSKGAENSKETANREKQLFSGIEQAFGINPDVLTSVLKPMFECCSAHGSHKDDKQAQKSEESDNNSPKDDKQAQKSEESDNNSPKDDKQAQKSEESDNKGVNENTSGNEATKTHIDQPAPTCSIPNDDILHAVPPFLRDTGIGSLLPAEQVKNLGEIIGTMMQNVASNVNLQPSDERSAATKEDSHPGEFIFVDNKECQKSGRTEEIFERQLTESLHQMEAMGFDNDGDWLKQLLIAKDLDISKVLDALNPPKV